MITVTPESDTLIRLQASGRIDAAEMEKGLEELLRLTRDRERVNMLYIVNGLTMPELSALAVEMKYLARLFALLRKLNRVAVVSDQGWVRTAAEIEGALIPSLRMKAFDAREEAAARAWLALDDDGTGATGTTAKTQEKSDA